MADFNYINVSDFECTGMITKSCDLPKLCIAIDEALIFDLEHTLCFDFIHGVLEQWETLPTDSSELTEDQTLYRDLIEGSTYRDCSGRLKRHLGIKKLWIYYAYAKYLIINAHNDSPNGLVTKQNDWSMPVPLKELNELSAKYRNMAKETLENVREYLCLNKEIFTNFDDCGCQLSCGCEGVCSCAGKPKRITGFSFRSVRK